LGDSYKLTAAATSRQESADEVGKHYSIKSFGGRDSAEQLARDEDVDLVVVAVKAPLHKQVAMPAINAKKAVFMEWPLGNGLKEALELAEAATKNGIRTMIGLQARQDPAIRKAKELLDQNKIGKILSTNLIGYGGSWGAQVQQRNAYTLDEKNGATMLTIPFGHFVDALVYLLGDFSSLSAYKATRRTETTIVETGEKIKGTAPDQLVVQGELTSGALATCHYKGGFQAPGSEGLVWEIEGEDGIITFKAEGVGHVQVSPALQQVGRRWFSDHPISFQTALYSWSDPSST
jgi:predicted dehydrogenase